MEFRLDQPDTVQCVECGRIRKDGEWSHEPPSDGRVVSHTICPTCQPAMLDHLRWDIEFPNWPREKQLEAIRLRVRHVPMDGNLVREKLATMGLGATDAEDFLLELSPFLVDHLCHYCKLPIESTDPVAERSGYVLHQVCAEKLDESLQVLTEMDPPAAHLDAYMDVARIPHGVRAGVRKDIESSFFVA